jgi:uncharacterized protein
MTATRLHHASPWVVDTRSLSRQPGSMKELEITAPATGKAATPVLEIPPGSEVELRLRLEAVAEGVMVSGRAIATAVGQCARCLADIEVDLDVAIRELFAYPDSTTAATTDDDEIPRIEDELIDLEPLVHDELVLAMPLAPFCSPDCQGLCTECGLRIEDVGPDHHHETLDPRWAALAARGGSADSPIAGGDNAGDKSADGHIVGTEGASSGADDSTEEN